MYYDHFGFQSPPFSISPDPRFLFLSERHRDALAHLIYGAGENGGFVLLTGQVGTGKTTLIRSLLSQELANVDIALCLHSGLSVIDFVASILDELKIAYEPNLTSLKPLVDALNAYLLKAHAAGRQTVLIIDEGQNLSREVLEQVRLLTNLETDSQKLLRIILVGQEELQDIINRPDLRQLSQRITGRYHLTALNPTEVNEYIAHRIITAKGNPSIFANTAMKQVAKLSGGVPRLINVLCDRALLVAYNVDMYRVTSKHVKIAAAETMPQKVKRTQAHPSDSPAWTSWVLPLGLMAMLGVAYGGYHFLQKLAVNEQAIADSSVVKPLNQQQSANMTKNDSNVSRETPTVVAVRPAQAVTGQNNSLREVQAVKTQNAKPSSPTVKLELVPTNKNPIETNVPKTSIHNMGINQTAGVQQLLKRWELPKNIPAQQTACQFAETLQMRCLMVRGSMPLIRAINRPVLLELQSNKGGKSTWLPIVGMNNSQQLICLHDNAVQVCDMSALMRYWSGSLLVLLRKPSVSIRIRPGFEGEQIRWLRQRLAIAEKRSLNSISSSLIFDKSLVDKVKIFQQSRYIDDDGIIGNETLLYLFNVVADEKTPLLYAEEI